MTHRATNVIASYFQQWRDSQVLLIQEHKAELFFKQRTAKRIYRECMDKLKLNKEHDKFANMKRAWLDRVHTNFILRECLLELAINAKRKIKAKRAAKLTQEKAYTAIKRRFLKVMMEESTDASRLRGVEETILGSYRKITLRKVLFAL